MSNYPPNQPPVIVQNYSQTPPPSQTSTWAIVSLVAAIAGGLLWGIGPIVAVIAGHVAKGEIRNSMGRLTGDGLATAGLILGYLQIAFWLVACCLTILSTVFGVAIPFCTIPFIPLLTEF